MQQNGQCNMKKFSKTKLVGEQQLVVPTSEL
jgi:hypothetical protein